MNKLIVGFFLQKYETEKSPRHNCHTWQKEAAGVLEARVADALGRAVGHLLTRNIKLINKHKHFFVAFEGIVLSVNTRGWFAYSLFVVKMHMWQDQYFYSTAAFHKGGDTGFLQVK